MSCTYTAQGSIICSGKANINRDPFVRTNLRGGSCVSQEGGTFETMYQNLPVPKKTMKELFIGSGASQFSLQNVLGSSGLTGAPTKKETFSLLQNARNPLQITDDMLMTYGVPFTPY